MRIQKMRMAKQSSAEMVSITVRESVPTIRGLHSFTLELNLSTSRTHS